MHAHALSFGSLFSAFLYDQRIKIDYAHWSKRMMTRCVAHTKRHIEGEPNPGVGSRIEGPASINCWPQSLPDPMATTERTSLLQAPQADAAQESSRRTWLALRLVGVLAVVAGCVLLAMGLAAAADKDSNTNGASVDERQVSTALY